MRTDFIEVEPAPLKEWDWTDCKLERLRDVRDILYKLENFWPLGVRDIYYRLTMRPELLSKSCWISHSNRNKGEKIKNLIDRVGELVTQARMNSYESIFFSIPLGELDLDIPWRAINDDGRQVSGKVGFSSTRQFLDQQIKGVFNGFSNCLAQSQENHVEIWIEKLGLYHIVKPVADDFCRQTLAVRGDASTTSLREYAERIKNLNYRRYIILYFGDYNIKGFGIPESVISRMRYGFRKKDVELIRCGLNKDQIVDLPPNPDGLKGTAKQKKAFRTEYGNDSYELNVLDPPELQRLVYDSLVEYTDMELLRLEREAGAKDIKKFDDLQVEVEKFARDRAANAGLIVG